MREVVRFAETQGNLARTEQAHVEHGRGAAVELDLDSVVAFLAIARQMHFGRAAHDLNLSASAITTRMHRLEVQVGASLVIRSPAGVAALTAAGERFAPRAERLIWHARDVRESVRGSRLDLKVGVVDAVGRWPDWQQLDDVQRALRRSHPDVRLRFEPIPFPRLTTALLEGAVDLIWPTTGESAPGIHATFLGAIPRVGVVARTHEFGEADSVSIESFAELPLLYDPTIEKGWMSDWYLGDVRPASDARLVECVAAKTPDVMKLVAAGEGCAIVFGALGPAIRPPLHVVSLDGPSGVNLYATRRENDHREPLLAAIGCIESTSRRRLGVH